MLCWHFLKRIIFLKIMSIYIKQYSLYNTKFFWLSFRNVTNILQCVCEFKKNPAEFYVKILNIKIFNNCDFISKLWIIDVSTKWVFYFTSIAKFSFSLKYNKINKYNKNDLYFKRSFFGTKSNHISMYIILNFFIIIFISLVKKL